MHNYADAPDAESHISGRTRSCTKVHEHALITGSPANSRSNSHVKSGDLPKDRHGVATGGDSGGRIRGGDGSRAKCRCQDRCGCRCRRGNCAASASVKIQGSPPLGAKFNQEEVPLIVSGATSDSREMQASAEMDSEAKLDQTEETPTIATDAEEETWSEWEARILREENSKEKLNQEELLDCEAYPDQEEETWSDWEARILREEGSGEKLDQEELMDSEAEETWSEWEARILQEEENHKEKLVVSISRSYLVDKFAVGETGSCELASNYGDVTESLLSLTIPDTAPEPHIPSLRIGACSSSAGLNSLCSLLNSCSPTIPCALTEDKDTGKSGSFSTYWN